MYEAFFGLHEKPFSLLPDPDFLYLSQKHQEALTLLEYGLLNLAGFIVLTGEIGCGKTTLMRYLLDQLDEDVTVGLIANTHESLGDPIDWICHAYDIHTANTSTPDLHQRFIDFLIDQYSKGRRTLLIVDEAQNLGVGKLEELRLLSNINSDKDLILQLMLLGQPQLRELLSHPDLEQFVQRVAASYHLGRLTADDTERYIGHRVAIAGGERQIFTADACATIHQYSNGIPRLINLICDTSLVYAYGAGQPQVTRDAVEEFVASQAQHLLMPIERAGDTGGGAADQGSGGTAHSGSVAPGASSPVAQISADERASSNHPPPAQGHARPTRPTWAEPPLAARATSPIPAEMHRPASTASGPTRSAPNPPSHWPPNEPDAARASARQTPQAQGNSIARPEAASVFPGYAPRRRPLPGSRQPSHQVDADLYIVGEPDPPRPPPRAKSRIIVLTSLLAVLAIVAAAFWLERSPELAEHLQTLLVTSTAQDKAPVDTDSEGKPRSPHLPEGNALAITRPPAEPTPLAATETREATLEPTHRANGPAPPAEPADQEADNTPQPSQSRIDASQSADKASGSAAIRPSGGGRPKMPSPSPSETAIGRSTTDMLEDPLETNRPTNPASRGQAATAAARSQALGKASPDPNGTSSAAAEAKHSAAESVAATASTNREQPISAPPTIQPATGNPSITALARQLSDLSVDVDTTSEGRLSVDLGKSVQFKIGSARLDSMAKEKLAEIAAVLAEFRETSVRVIGHTDTAGPDSVNKWLSTRRALAVAEFLASAGVSTERLSHEGRGESDLKVDAEEELIRGRWVNRRIVLEIQARDQRTPG